MWVVEESKRALGIVKWVVRNCGTGRKVLEFWNRDDAEAFALRLLERTGGTHVRT